MKNKSVRIIFSILLCELIGIIGAFFTTPAIATWYVKLTKPFFSPPNWIFAPVWTLLYALMGFVLSYLWEKRTVEWVKTILRFFFIQLFLNFLWSLVFFGLHSPLFSLIDIILLWAFIFVITTRLLSTSKKHALLMIPYLLWVSFALTLNFSIYILNK